MEHSTFALNIGHIVVPIGSTVEVRTRYLSGQWAHGYEIAEVLPAGYRIRRCGSQEVLSEVFADADVRPEDHR